MKNFWSILLFTSLLLLTHLPGYTSIQNKTILAESDLLSQQGVQGTMLELKAEFELAGATSFGLKVAVGETEETIVGYNVETSELFVDRSRSGETQFHTDFTSYSSVVLKPENNRIQLHLFLDRSSLEVFGNDGRVSLTNRIFPTEEGSGIVLFAKEGEVHLQSLDVWNLSDIWP